MDEKIEIHPDIVLLDTQKNINWQIWNRLSVWSFSRGSINLANAAKCCYKTSWLCNSEDVRAVDVLRHRIGIT
jgi:hypothetical protein